MVTVNSYHLLIDLSAHLQAIATTIALQIIPKLLTTSNNIGKTVAVGAVNRGAKYQLEMGGKRPILYQNYP